MPAPLTEVQRGYKLFRKRYGPMLRAAKREMDTPLRKALVETIAATAFSAGYNTPRASTKPIALKGWKAGK